MGFPQTNFKSPSGIYFGEKAGSPTRRRNKDGISISGTYYVDWDFADALADDFVGDMVAATGTLPGGTVLYTQRRLPVCWPNLFPPPQTFFDPKNQYRRPVFAQSALIEPLPGTVAYEDFGFIPGSLSAVIDPASGLVVGFQVNYPGSGYLSTPALDLSGGGGSGAQGAVTLADGQIQGAVVTNPSSGYTSAPVVQLTGGGPSDGVRGFSNTYDWAQVGVEYTTFPYTVNQNVNAPLFAQDIAPDGSLYYTMISFQVAGKDVLLPAQTFLWPTGGQGSGASATCTVANGKITSVTVTNPGMGYTAATKDSSTGQYPPPLISNAVIQFVGGGGFNATAFATIDSTNAGITGIFLTDPGIGYTSPPQVVITSGLTFTEPVPLPIPNSQVTIIRKACAVVPNVGPFIGTLAGPFLQFGLVPFAQFPLGTLRLLGMDTEPVNSPTGRILYDLKFACLYQPNENLQQVQLGHNSFYNINISPRDFQTIYSIIDGGNVFQLADWSPLWT
jgi:hypothetical protein